MKKTAFAIFMALILLSGFAACDRVKIEIKEPEKTPVFSGEETLETPYEDIRDFCLSEEAKNAVIKMIASDKEIEDCEICALYRNIVTFKISIADSSLDFCTFEVLTEKDCALKPLSKRTFDKFEKGCEFFPTLEDGYPRSAFSTISPYSFISSEISSAGKVQYAITEIGSELICTKKEDIEFFLTAVDEIEAFPIERFLTKNEKNLGVDLSSNVLEFYTSQEEEVPFCTIFLDMITVSEKGETGRLYYVNNYSAIDEVRKKIEYKDILVKGQTQTLPVDPKSYSMRKIDFPVMIGHTSNSYFTDSYLLFSAQAFNKNSGDSLFDGNSCFFRTDLPEGKTEITEDFENDVYSESYVRTFADDRDGNLYYVAQGTEPGEKYSCKICLIDQFGKILSSVDLNRTFDSITGIINDGENNWYVSSSDTVYMFDDTGSLRNEFLCPCSGKINSLIRILDDPAIVVSEKDLYNIYVLNQDRTNFSYYATLPYGTSQVFNGNSQYNFFYLVTDGTYSQILYGWNSSGYAEILLDYKDYFSKSVGTINVRADEENRIFLLTEGYFDGRTATSELVIFEPNEE